MQEAVGEGCLTGMLTPPPCCGEYKEVPRTERSECQAPVPGPRTAARLRLPLLGRDGLGGVRPSLQGDRDSGILKFQALSRNLLYSET